MITGTKTKVRTEKRWMGLRPWGLIVWIAKLNRAVTVINAHHTYPTARCRIVPLGKSSCETPIGNAASTVTRCAMTAGPRRSRGMGADESVAFRRAAVARRKTMALPTTATGTRRERGSGRVRGREVIDEPIYRSGREGLPDFSASAARGSGGSAEQVVNKSP